MEDLSDFQKGQFFGARMSGASVTRTVELFGIARRVMTAFEKEGKTFSLEESESYQIETVTLVRGLLGKITRIKLRKLQQSLMTISRTQFPQKLLEGSCTKPDFTGGLQLKKNIKIDLFEISLLPLFYPTPVNQS